MNPPIFPGERQSFHNFPMYVDGPRRVVVPGTVADGKPWVWRARFWGHEPQFDLAMLERGYHIAYCDVSNLYGSPEAIQRWDDFYDYLRFEHLFSDRPVLEGMSRGGLIVYNWAAAHPDQVACIYGDNPVCDFKSWPGGKGTGPGSPDDWERLLAAYDLTDEEAQTYGGNPVDNLAPLAAAGIPLLHVIGEADEIVPVAENSDVLEARYRALGGMIEVIRKPGGLHHPHSLENPQPIVDFVLRHQKGRGSAPAEAIASLDHFERRSAYTNSRIRFERDGHGHVAFLGGSITEMEGYRPILCDRLQKRFPETTFTFTNAGISSTCSDTGSFRLDRDVLSQGPLDLLFVEFAVNDAGDGFPTPERALRGMEGVIAQARAHNPCVDIVMTFFVTPEMIEAFEAGREVPTLSAHSKVAEHYDVSVNHLARAVTELIRAGTIDWKLFGGVHPNRYGNTLCATTIWKALENCWSSDLSETANPVPYARPALLDPLSYVNGRFLLASAIALDPDWQQGVPDWPNENNGKVRPRFEQTPMIYAHRAHASLTVNFSGTAIGAYLLSGPDAGIVRCTIDGARSKEMDILHKHSTFNYPMTVMFFDDLPAGPHTLALEILENRPGRRKPGGTAFRALSFVAS
jgi:pimeloyl-ACP methyl ester carboxylesterase/lysophospholipase L1-like esterase